MSEKKERIVLDVAYQPQVRTGTDTRRIMLDVMIALLPAVAVAVWQFGVYPLAVIAVSMASAVFFEWGYRKLMKKTNTVGDLSACVTGMLLALTLPPTAPLWLPVIGTFFGIVVVKQLYGGIGKNFLNPALAARAFLLASYALLMGQYAVPSSLAGIDGVTSATPLSFLYDAGAMPGYMNLQTMFLGTIPGSIGEVSALALLVGFAYLLVRKVIHLHGHRLCHQPRHPQRPAALRRRLRRADGADPVFRRLPRGRQLRYFDYEPLYLGH